MLNKQRNYTKEDIEFIKKNIETMSYKEIAFYFSKKYSMPFRADSISHVARRNGIKKQTRVYSDRKNGRYKVEYTMEMLEFLRCNFEKCSRWKELADLFNCKFKTDMTSNEIRGVCKRVYGFEMENPTTFRKGLHPFVSDIGTEKIGSGYRICVKVSNDDLKPGDSSNWKQKSRVVYEEANGNIPDGCLIVHLDGNKNNFELSNLYCVNKKVMACLARENWHKKDRELTLTAIKCAELMCKLKESEE